MSKSELIAAIAEKAKISKEEADVALSATFDVITDTMINGGKVAIPKFGNFQAKIRAERKGRNPATGKEMTIPKTVVANFKAATQLKEKLNQE